MENLSHKKGCLFKKWQPLSYGIGYVFAFLSNKGRRFISSWAAR